MSTQSNGTDLSFVAGADLSTHQFKAVKLSAAKTVVLAGLGEAAIGVLQNKPGNGESATVRVYGVTKIKAGGAIAAGDAIKSSAAGLALAAAAATTNTSDAGAAADPLVGSHVLGRALVAGVSGDVVEMLIVHAGAVPSTAA